MDGLPRGVVEADSTLVHEAVHTFKGASGSMFGLRISALAAEIDTNYSYLGNVSQLMPDKEQAASDTIDWWRSQSG